MTDCIIDIPTNICGACEYDHDDDDDYNQIDRISQEMEGCNIENQKYTIYVATLLEKTIKETILQKEYDEESGEFYLNIKLPNWFTSIDKKYQDIIIKLIHPVIKNIIER